MDNNKINKKTQEAILQDAFRQADKNGDGRLSLDEIIVIFKANNATISEADLRATFSQCDTDKSGDLDLEEYGKFCKKADIELDSVPQTKDRTQTQSKKVSGGPIQEPKRVSDMNNAEIAFSLFDDNRDGYVTSKEMMKRSKNLTADQVDKVFKKFDTDGDGRLSFAEFKRMMVRQNNK